MPDLQAEADELAAHAMHMPTSAELDVVRLLAQGLTYAAIGNKLGLSEQGAKRRGMNAAHKLGCNNAAHTVAVAIGRGLIQGARA